MQNDNSTPISAIEYDLKIERTIPFYSEFYLQTLDLVRSLGFVNGRWLDVGCGTGEFILQAYQEFDKFQFVLCDPSEAMINEATHKLRCVPEIDFRICASQHFHDSDAFNVITAIQSHHYMRFDDRVIATQNCYSALKKEGAYIFFENYAPNCEYSKKVVLDRWGRYQKKNGKSDVEVAEHLARYGKNYFPITLAEHFSLLQDVGFQTVEMFWLSYMQVGIYAIKS